MNKPERAQFDLEMILPYVNHLKAVINNYRRIERRKAQVELCYEGEALSQHTPPYNSEPIVVFERPLTDIERLASVREELKRI